VSLNYFIYFPKHSYLLPSTHGLRLSPNPRNISLLPFLLNPKVSAVFRLATEQLTCSEVAHCGSDGCPPFKTQLQQAQPSVCQYFGAQIPSQALYSFANSHALKANHVPLYSVERAAYVSLIAGLI
jgi:hypothetical protein